MEQFTILSGSMLRSSCIWNAFGGLERASLSIGHVPKLETMALSGCNKSWALFSEFLAEEAHHLISISFHLFDIIL